MVVKRKKTGGKAGLKATAVRAALAERARDACRLKRAGLGYEAIAAKLGCSLGNAYNLVQRGIAAYQDDAKEETAAWVTEAIAGLLQGAQEAWIQWERSKQDRVLNRTKTTKEGIETVQEIEGQCAGAQYLEAFRKCMDQIAKLRGVYTKKFDARDWKRVTPLTKSIVKHCRCKTDGPCLPIVDFCNSSRTFGIIGRQNGPFCQIGPSKDRREI